MPVASLSDDHPFARLAVLFRRLLGGVSDLILKLADKVGRGFDKLARNALVTPLLGLADALWGGLAEAAGDVADAAGAVIDFVGSGVETLLETGVEFVETLLASVDDMATETLQTGVEIALGLIEGVKKAIHLVLDRIDDSKIGAAVASGPETVLDLIDNMLGNTAELASPALGARARTLRADMYGQLRDVRAAEAAKAGKSSGAGQERNAGRADPPAKPATKERKPKVRRADR
ncbi:MAG: hypothetical protein AAF763_15980 [Pseudomonadota bacterium]